MPAQTGNHLLGKILRGAKRTPTALDEVFIFRHISNMDFISLAAGTRITGQTMIDHLP